MLAERRRLELDERDEVWDGVLHMVPPAGARSEARRERSWSSRSGRGDEIYEKIDFYAGLGVREMLIVHPDGRWVELLRAVGGRLHKPVTLTAYTLVDGNYEHVVRDIAGTVTIPSPVGITLNPDALITR
jgi:hypothetical protein